VDDFPKGVRRIVEHVRTVGETRFHSLLRLLQALTVPGWEGSKRGRGRGKCLGQRAAWLCMAVMNYTLKLKNHDVRLY
jgi:hypothetical protein